MIAHSLLNQCHGVGRSLRLLFVAAVLGVVTCRPRGPASSREVDAENARRAIEQRLVDWTRWTAAGQIDSVADIFTTDAWESDPNLPPIAGRTAIVEHWRRAVATGRWQFEPHIEEVIIRDSIAVA